MVPSATTHSRNLSEEFDSLDAIMSQDATRLAALTEENATLRDVLARRDSQSRPPTLSPEELATIGNSQLQAELDTSRRAQEEMARELAALRSEKQSIAAAAVEHHSEKVEMLTESLATIASELEFQKSLVVTLEARVKEEEEKVATLRQHGEESRRALMRIQNESQRKMSTGDSLSALSARRASQGGLFETATRRRSSFGLPPPGGLGLGFESSGSRSALGRQSISHRRGSASMSGFETPGEEDRMARLRDLRYGNTTTKCSSRRNSAINGNDFAGDLDYEPERRRIPSFSYPSGNSIDEEGGSPNPNDLMRPPSAPLRWQGRKQSVAVFDNWSRRSSLDSFGGDFIGAPYIERSNSTGAAPSAAELMYELDGLRVQLAESEEGRRASEYCLKSLKEFIASPSTSEEGGMSLPPLPTDADPEDLPFAPTTSQSKRSSISRWAMPRLPSLGRRESGSASSTSTSPNLTTYTRRLSTSSSASATTFVEKPSLTPFASAPIFGGFSFSSVAPPRPVAAAAFDDGDTSPTMIAAAAFQSPSGRSESDSEATAPSLTDSSASSESSRSSSPTAESDFSPLMDDNLVKICDATFGSEGCLAPSVVIDGKALLSPVLSQDAPSFQFGLMP
ncbi:hypothetical protein RQP46_003388 [Phenoliferia psychrophenolica]